MKSIFSILFISQVAGASLMECNEVLLSLRMAREKSQLNDIYCGKKPDFFRNCAVTAIKEHKLEAVEVFQRHLETAQDTEYRGDCKKKEQAAKLCNASLAGLFTDAKVPGSETKIREVLNNWAKAPNETVNQVSALIKDQLIRAGHKQFESTKDGDYEVMFRRDGTGILVVDDKSGVLILPNGAVNTYAMKDGRRTPLEADLCKPIQSAEEASTDATIKQ